MDRGKPTDRPDWFAFYPADFAGDINVAAMTTEQVGAYILLLCQAWQSDPPGTLPDDDVILARLARVDLATWERIKPGVLRAFVKHKLASGSHALLQKRLAHEAEQSIRRIESFRNRGKKGAASRWNNRQVGCKKDATRKAKPAAKQSSASAQPVHDDKLGLYSNSNSIEDKSTSGTLAGDDASAIAVAPKARQPDPLFDAIAEVTGTDPKVSGSFVGKVRAALAKGDPPYTAAEVLSFGRRFFELCPYAAQDGRRPTLGEIEKNIGLVRTGQPGKPAGGRPGGFQTHDQRVMGTILGAMAHGQEDQDG